MTTTDGTTTLSTSSPVTTANGTRLELMTSRTTDGTDEHHLLLTVSDEPLTRADAQELATILSRFAVGGGRLWGRQ